ncbi:MAG: hypothetical protein ACLQVL_03365 [Terriglobia bacterium]
MSRRAESGSELPASKFAVIAMLPLSYSYGTLTYPRPSSQLSSVRVKIYFMVLSSLGRAPWRVIAIQLLIVLGLVALYKIYLPRHARELAKREVAARELKINTIFRDSVEEDSTREISVPLDGAIVKRHPQRLRTTFSPQEAETTLGVPDVARTDFRGGQHLTWWGTTHKLEVSFDAGRLYCLNLEDRATGHGVLVYRSPELWHPY